MVDDKHHTLIHRNMQKDIEENSCEIKNVKVKIDAIEKNNISINGKIENLCKQVSELVTAIKWGSGLLITTLLAFFMWYIKSIGGI